MRRSADFRPFRHSPVWLLAIGLFAMALQALGGSGLMPRMSAGGLQLEICTSKGVGKLAATSQPGGTSLPDAGHQDCCKLCAAGAQPLLVDAVPGVPPAPTFGNIVVAAVLHRPAAIAWLSHPPRGPPAA